MLGVFCALLTDVVGNFGPGWVNDQDLLFLSECGYASSLMNTYGRWRFLIPVGGNGYEESIPYPPINDL